MYKHAFSSFITALLFAWGSIPSHAYAQSASTPTITGQWITEDGKGVFDIHTCGDKMCGNLVGLNLTQDEEASGRRKTECNLQMLKGFHPMEDRHDHWKGHIFDPQSKNTYDAIIWVAEDGSLKLHGFLGLELFGRTDTWQPFHGHIGNNCRINP